MQPYLSIRCCCRSVCPGGGIGRRSRLKICRSQGCAGSIPVPGTEVDFGNSFQNCHFYFWLQSSLTIPIVCLLSKLLKFFRTAIRALSPCWYIILGIVSWRYLNAFNTYNYAITTPLTRFHLPVLIGKNLCCQITGEL